MKERKDSELSIVSVFPNPNQPRKDFDPEKLEELAMSIRQYGVLEPIVVTPRDDRYMIIAGERRYRASLLAGLKKIPARVLEADDALVEELALLENIQRQDLNIIEEAKAYQALLDRGWPKEELALKMGFKQTWRVDERTSLLKLDPEYQEFVVKGTLGNSQAFEMSRLTSGNQKIVCKRILSGELNTYNKLRAFVDGLLMLERQETVFALEPMTEGQKESLINYGQLIGKLEVFLRSAFSPKQLNDLSQAVAKDGHGSLEKLDYIIGYLQKVRKAVCIGAGANEALQAEKL